MNQHALRVIEFPSAVDLVAGRASSSTGAERIREASPRSDREWIAREHSRVTAMRALLEEENPWSPQRIPDVQSALSRLRVAGATLNAAELLAIADLLRSSRLTSDSLNGAKVPVVTKALLADEIDSLFVSPADEKRIGAAIDDDANVRDEASPLLRRVRRELRGSQGELVKLLERIMSNLESHYRVPDMSVTVRNGRFVVPVRREARSAVGGIVHDTSSTGATLFVEPPAAVEAGNRIRELEAEELREVDRILFELSESVRPATDALDQTFNALTELDTLYARARFAIEFECAAFDLSPSADGFAIVNGRHPLLLAQGIPVVAFDLTLERDERTLLISGPNTGGKTVLLKALGLFAALAQSGIPVPVGKGSRLAIFDEVYADVGDEQSISSSLSTFSAHIRNLAEVLREATSESLVLIDELGSGTDPVEGAALGGAILESLTRRGSLSVATTHLGALKELATEVPGVVNASLQFDPVLLAPTYRLIKGIPGRSYGISIARRLALPEDILANAEARLPTGERDVNALLAELESREQELSETEKETAAIAEDARTRARRVAEREKNVKERERNAERDARREARRVLLDARDEVERTIKELRAAAAEATDAAAREARRRVEQLAADEAENIAQLDRQEAAEALSEERRGTPAAPTEGDFVAVPSLGGKTARLMEIRGDDAIVAIGSMKLSVPRDTLSVADAPESGERVHIAIRGDTPELEAKSEIDLRGMRAAEIEDLVMRAVDSAVRADLKTLRFIHGKGTGALRERVAEMLSKESRVSSFRLGAWNEGGAGVTVAELT
ncbi:MAG TPA: endonuclease MutS2 [Gemmatimonadaceae bacterium]|nr:endonuclease MutS2 [Gemmatimonadaceae bacterium]